MIFLLYFSHMVVILSMNRPVKLIYLSKISKVLWKKNRFPKTVSGDSIAIRAEYKKRKGC